MTRPPSFDHKFWAIWAALQSSGTLATLVTLGIKERLFVTAPDQSILSQILRLMKIHLLQTFIKIEEISHDHK